MSGVKVFGKSGEDPITFPPDAITAVVGGTSAERSALIERLYDDTHRRYQKVLSQPSSNSRADEDDWDIVSCPSQAAFMLHGRDATEWDPKALLSKLVLMRDPSKPHREPRFDLSPEILAGLDSLTKKTQRALINSVPGLAKIISRAHGQPIGLSANHLGNEEWTALLCCRALSKCISSDNTALVLLDAPTASMSESEEEHFCNSMRKVIGTSTGQESSRSIVLTSPRFTAALHADHVVVLESTDDGSPATLSEQGPPSALLTRGGLFAVGIYGKSSSTTTTTSAPTTLM
jgi:hypothetical protein